MSRALFPLLFLLSGCVSHQVAEKEISQCPDYFRNNIGEVKIEPLSPFSVIFKGYVHLKEEGCPIHLLALADRNTVLEEAFHSFEFRAGTNRVNEWGRFYQDFHKDGTTYKNYGGLFSSLVILTIPFVDKLPVDGKVNFHSTVSHFEDTAECFVFVMRQHQTNDAVLLQKCEAIKKFVNGVYSQ